MQEILEQFLKERKYLVGVTDGTIEYYREIYGLFERVGAVPFSKQSVNEAIIKMQERGTSPNAINSYLRGLRVLIKWMSDNGHIEPFLVPFLKAEQRILPSLTDSEMKMLINYKPNGRFKKLHTICLVCLDTGCRINEVLSLKRDDIDFDNLLFKVLGKGQKERIIPFSFELRKLLHKHLKSHKFPLVFCNNHGGKLRYDNMSRDLGMLCKDIGLHKRIGFHRFRRTFATNYIRQGGNPFVLQRLLGHSSLEQTNKYIKLVVDDLQLEQHRACPEFCVSDRH